MMLRFMYSSYNICISSERKASVFPQPALCALAHPILFDYKEWEQEQLFHNHTITQTMRKNANMVLRCQGVVVKAMIYQSFCSGPHRFRRFGTKTSPF